MSGQVVLFLVLGAQQGDRLHGQPGLHAEEGPDAAVSAWRPAASRGFRPLIEAHRSLPVLSRSWKVQPRSLPGSRPSLGAGAVSDGRSARGSTRGRLLRGRGAGLGPANCRRDDETGGGSDGSERTSHGRGGAARLVHVHGVHIRARDHRDGAVGVDRERVERRSFRQLVGVPLAWSTVAVPVSRHAPGTKDHAERCDRAGGGGAGPGCDATVSVDGMVRAPHGARRYRLRNRPSTTGWHDRRPGRDGRGRSEPSREFVGLRTTDRSFDDGVIGLVEGVEREVDRVAPAGRRPVTMRNSGWPVTGSSLLR